MARPRVGGERTASPTPAWRGGSSPTPPRPGPSSAMQVATFTPLLSRYQLCNCDICSPGPGHPLRAHRPVSAHQGPGVFHHPRPRRAAARDGERQAAAPPVRGPAGDDTHTVVTRASDEEFTITEKAFSTLSFL